MMESTPPPQPRPTQRLSDATAVTGSPLAPPTVRRGDVIGERYEVRGRLRDDAFSHGFLALDHESEEPVLLRVVRAELLESADRGAVVRALQRHVGVGGRFLPGMLDADRDGAFVYATEPVPTGVTLRDFLDRRIHGGRRVSPTELLPVLAFLDAALAAIPPGAHHGDVHAALVWVDPDRLQLTGAFFVPALPEGAVAAVLGRHGDLRRRFAPEVLVGDSSAASDRYAVAAIAHEMLTLQPPPSPGEAVSASLGVLAAPLGALLHPSPHERAESLEPLLEALARVTGLPVPELDPAAFGHVRPLSSAPSSAPSAPSAPSASRMSAPSSDVIAGLPKELSLPDAARAVLDEMRTEKLPALSAADAEALLAGARRAPKAPVATPRLVGIDPRLVRAAAASGGAPELSRGAEGEGAHHLSVLTSVPAADGSLVRGEGLARGEGLDPRLVRAALGEDEPRCGAPSDLGGEDSGELDPRLVRVALGVAIADSVEEEVPLDPSVPAKPRKERTQELRLEDLEADEEEEVPLDPSVPAKPRKERTQELRLEDLEADEEEEVPLDPSVPAKPRKERTQELRLEDVEALAPSVTRPSPEGLSPPQTASADLHPPEAREAGDGLEELAQMSRSLRPTREPTETVVRPRAPELAGAPTVVRAEPRPAPGDTRTRLVIFALLLGVAIIVASFAYAWTRKRSQDELRRQRLQERFEQLRQPTDGE
ncbi:MAG: hypothetical protein KF901_16145 [Myxococcales bacterium]|nr:hypothetical protein [Myxococcales bacterium]